MNIKPPEFPTGLAFKHGFELYGDAFMGIDWICPAYNFAVALSHVSMALGRSCVVVEQGVHYPNFYQAILGRSHLAAKSPTLSRALSGVDHLKRNVDPPELINVVSSINSVPGFKEGFATHERGDPEDPMHWFSKGNGVRAFVPFDELAILLMKSRQNNTEGLASELTQYYSPSELPIENNTRQNKSYGEDWVINVFGCSTLAWYEKYITQGDFTSGFLNRFVFYLHEQQPVQSRFGEVDKGSLGQWQALIVGLMDDSKQFQVPRQFRLSDEAFEVFDKWFVEVYEYLIEDADDIKREASARVISQTLKLALVYGVLNNSGDNLISLSAFESAQAVGRYWGECMGMTLDTIDFDRASKVERMIMEAVQRVTEKDGECTKRTLRRAINRNSMSTDELNKGLESLVHGDLLDYLPTERKKLILVKSDDED